MPTTCLVIGGGPAGSMAAMLLAQRGLRVTLVEQARFPRDKVCGECLSALGIDVLSRHDLIEPVRRRGAIPLTRSLFHAPTGEHVELTLQRPMLGISRRTLDALLLDTAANAGVTILQPARCESLRPSSTGVTATVRSIDDQHLREISADFAIVADGKSNLPTGRPAMTGDFGLKAHFTGVEAPANAIELFGVTGHYGGLSEVEDGKWNSSFSVPATRLRAARGRLDQLFADITAENPAFAHRMRNAQRCSDWHTSPLPRFGVISNWPKNVIPVGNAAAAIEPIGGEGIGLALRSAELAVEAIMSGRFDPAVLRERYRTLWNARRFACRAAAKLIASPTIAGPALSMLQADHPITDALLRWMGKTAD